MVKLISDVLLWIPIHGHTVINQQIKNLSSAVRGHWVMSRRFTNEMAYMGRWGKRVKVNPVFSSFDDDDDDYIILISIGSYLFYIFIISRIWTTYGQHMENMDNISLWNTVFAWWLLYMQSINDNFNKKKQIWLIKQPHNFAGSPDVDTGCVIVSWSPCPWGLFSEAIAT